MNTANEELIGRVRTKIVATVGPACAHKEKLRALARAGVDVFRLNFSHGAYEEHAAVLDSIREVEREEGIHLAVLQDLCGPKIRLGRLVGGTITCDYNDEFTLVTHPPGDENPRWFSSTYHTLADDLEVGQAVLFADGNVGMVVVERGPGWARMRTTLPGVLRSNQGINVPGGGLSVAALTEKDLADLDWTATHEVDYIGLSFVRHADDVIQLRGELEKRGIKARIIAKIEKPQALDNLHAIIAETDAIMVARGDLGVELDVTRVPAAQKYIVDACHHARVPVITATQMLNSMETSSRPTRAEASDVFNAVLDGTDAVMLSGETAIGLYPVEAVSTMSRIAAEAEDLLFSRLKGGGAWTWSLPESPSIDRGLLRADLVAKAGRVQPVTESVVEAASMITRKLRAAMMAVSTHSGRTALVLSKQRNASPTLALAYDIQTARAMGLFWGVTAVLMPSVPPGSAVRAWVIEWCRERGLLKSGDIVVGIRGSSPEDPTHNEIVVFDVS